MSDLYDYSHVPKFSRRWYLNAEKSHWIDVVVGEAGLTYIGTDWSCLSGGDYMAGFQTFDEFFEKGPINDMPENIAKELENHLKTHRREGGAGLLLTHTNKLSGLVLWRAFIHLDDKPVKIISISEMGDEPEVVFFDGALAAGEHSIGLVFIFKERDKQGEEDPLWKVRADFNFSIEPGTKGKKFIQLVTLREDPDGDIVTRGLIGYTKKLKLKK